MQELSASQVRIDASDKTIKVAKAKDGTVYSTVEAHSFPDGNPNCVAELHTWLILRALGEGWPESPPSPALEHGISEEIERLERCLRAISDPHEYAKVQNWAAGYFAGWQNWE